MCAVLFTLQGLCEKILNNIGDDMYYVYIMRCSDNSLYTGVTTDVERRFKEHKAKKGAKYTASRKVVSIEAIWEAPDRSSALKLESQIKKLSKAKKEELILKK